MRPKYCDCPLFAGSSTGPKPLLLCYFRWDLEQWKWKLKVLLKYISFINGHFFPGLITVVYVRLVIFMIRSVCIIWCYENRSHLSHIGLNWRLQALKWKSGWRGESEHRKVSLPYFQPAAHACSRQRNRTKIWAKFWQKNKNAIILSNPMVGI